MMNGPLGAELMKLRKAWSTRILIAIVVVAQVLLGYLIIWAILQVPEPEEGGLGAARGVILATLSPEYVVANALGMLAGLGGSMALVIGVLATAREFGWRTVANLATQGTGRIAIVTAKAAAVVIVMLIIVVLDFAAAAATSAVITAAEEGELTYPPAGELAAGIGAGWLILTAWASVGIALGLLLRGTGLAIGLGLVYALVIESLVAAFAGASSVVETVARGLLGVNAAALASAFSQPLPPELGGSPLDIAPASAVFILAAYALVALAIASAVFRRRDIS